MTEIIILIQAVANCVLVFWVFKEYANNQYLQTYVGSFVRANMVALDVAIIGVAMLAIGFLARFKNLFRKVQPLPSEVALPAILPARARLENRAKRAADSSSKGSAASDALANAAARVFRQMELGQGSVAHTSPAMSPVREGVELGRGSENKLSAGARPPIVRRLEPEQPSRAKQWPENRSLARAEVEQKRDQVRWPMVQRPQTVVVRPGLGQSVGERNLAQQSLPGLKPLEMGLGSLEKFSPGSPPVAKQAEQGRGAEDKPSLQLPAPSRHVESGQGPLDNPLPTNPLFPLLRQAEPGESREYGPVLQQRPVTGQTGHGLASLVNPTPRNSQPSLKSEDQKPQDSSSPEGVEQPPAERSLFEKRLPAPKRGEPGQGSEERGSQ